MARGRPQKPYHPTFGGDPIPGLYKCPDGRWRINATGQKFTEPDERRAIDHFYKLTRREPISIIMADSGQGVRSAVEAVEATINPATVITAGDDGTAQFNRAAQEAAMWKWMHDQIMADRVHAAKMCGIPGLARIDTSSVPKPGIKLADLIEVYQRENPSTDKSKREAVSVFKRLMSHAQAETLDDLTQSRLLAFRSEIERSGRLQSAGTRAGYYGRIKTIISFGLKVGMDQAQIRAVLDRCSVLWTGEALPPVQPSPIRREHFHALLKQAGHTPWRAWLLLGLNLCMYVEDLCELRWADFDLDKGTYAALRVKTRRDRIPRAGVLWPETVDVLRNLARKGPFVFTSSHGTRYNKNTRINDFKELREAAGLPAEVKFSSLRDGAYTAACQDAPDERWARILAGHRAAGLQDNYVLRNPERTRPACDAVYKAYGPFPVPGTPPQEEATRPT